MNIVKNQKGERSLLFEGNVYTVDRKGNDRTI